MKHFLLIGHCVASIIVGVSTLSMVQAEDTAGHAKYHSDFYSKQRIPGSGASCCNDHDCRPVKYRHTAHGVEVYIDKLRRWIVPPQERVMFKDTPDNGGHWCGLEHGIGGSNSPHTYCAIVPIPSI